MYIRHTANNYPLPDVVSALQKSIRRSDHKVALWFAYEMFRSNFKEYLWRRLLIIAAEDCNRISFEVVALRKSYEILLSHPSKNELTGLIFVLKAVVVMCTALKNRDADHSYYDMDFNAAAYNEMAQNYLDNLTKHDKETVPDYTYDCHTPRGKRAGKSKFNFLVDEFDGLKPKQRGLFDDFPKQFDNEKELEAQSNIDNMLRRPND